MNKKNKKKEKPCLWQKVSIMIDKANVKLFFS